MNQLKFRIDCQNIQVTEQLNALTIYLTPFATIHTKNQKFPLQFIHPQALEHLERIFHKFIADQQSAQTVQQDKSIHGIVDNIQNDGNGLINRPLNNQNNQESKDTKKQQKDKQTSQNQVNNSGQNLMSSNANTMKKNVFATSSNQNNPFIINLKPPIQQPNKQSTNEPSFMNNRINPSNSNGYQQPTQNIFSTNNNNMMNNSNYQGQNRNSNNMINPFTSGSNQNNQNNISFNNSNSNSYGNSNPYGNRNSGNPNMNPNQPQSNMFIPVHNSNPPSLFGNKAPSQTTSYMPRNRFGGNNKNAKQRLS